MSRHEKTIIRLMADGSSVTLRLASCMCRISINEAWDLLHKLEEEGFIRENDDYSWVLN